MIKSKTEKVELRGIANKTSKNGSVYYMVNVEDAEGAPYSFYCKSAEAFPDGLKKGDMVIIDFAITQYNNKEQLVVHTLHKVG